MKAKITHAAITTPILSITDAPNGLYVFKARPNANLLLKLEGKWFQNAFIHFEDRRDGSVGWLCKVPEEEVIPWDGTLSFSNS